MGHGQPCGERSRCTSAPQEPIPSRQPGAGASHSDAIPGLGAPAKSVARHGDHHWGRSGGSGRPTPLQAGHPREPPHPRPATQLATRRQVAMFTGNCTIRNRSFGAIATSGGGASGTCMAPLLFLSSPDLRRARTIACPSSGGFDRDSPCAAHVQQNPPYSANGRCARRARMVGGPAILRSPGALIGPDVNSPTLGKHPLQAAYTTPEANAQANLSVVRSA